MIGLHGHQGCTVIRSPCILGLPVAGVRVSREVYDAPTEVKRCPHSFGIERDERKLGVAEPRLGYQPGVYFMRPENRYYWIYLGGESNEGKKLIEMLEGYDEE